MYSEFLPTRSFGFGLYTSRTHSGQRCRGFLSAVLALATVLSRVEETVASAKTANKKCFTALRFGVSHGAVEKTGANAQTANVSNPISLL